MGRVTMKQILEQLKNYETEFKSFMEIQEFPIYELELKNISMKEIDSNKYTSIASASYQVQKGIHTLEINTNIPLEKYLLFHEFIHILDTERYARKNGNRNLGLTCYTEYHASQVELMQLLGANCIHENILISVNNDIILFNKKKSIYQFVEEKRQTAIDLFRNKNVLNEINTITMAIGVLCNYFGLRSICKMYANDYDEIIENSAFLEIIPSYEFSQLDSLMQGWLDENKIEKSITLCFNILLLLIHKNS